MNSVSLKKVADGWELHYSIETAQVEKFADIDGAIAKLKELETKSTPA